MTSLRIFLTKIRLFTKHLSDEIGITNLFLLCLLAIITIFPLFFGGFTTHDDVDFAVWTWERPQFIQLWQRCIEISIAQGRFAFLWVFPFHSLSYIIDSRVWYLFIKFGSFFLLLSSLYYTVFQIFRSSWVALTSLVFFLAIVQNNWDYNLLTSYPFSFNALAVLFLLSLGLFAKAIDRKKLILASIAGILYFFALAHESFVLFSPLYGAILLSRAEEGQPIINQLKSGKNYIFTIAFALAAYLLIYVAWRHFYPSMYDGNNLDGHLDIIAIIKVVTTYSLASFPWRLFIDLKSLLTTLPNLSITYLIKPAITGFLFAKLMTKDRFIVPQERILWIGIILTFIGIFLPNLLLGFTQKHQQIVVSGGLQSYAYTYYSLIVAVVFLSLFLAYINNKSFLWRSPLRVMFICVVVAVMMFTSFAVDVKNQQISFEQKLSHQKWQLIESVVESPSFMEMPNHATVVAPTLLSHIRGIVIVYPEDWSSYVNHKTGKSIQFVDNKRKCSAVCYSLVFRQALYSNNQFIVLSKMDLYSVPTSTKLTVYSMPAQDSVTIFGSFTPGRFVPKLEVNGKSVKNIGAASFFSKLSNVSISSNTLVIQISGNVDLHPEGIVISPYIVEPQLRPLLPLSEELSEGIDFTDEYSPKFIKDIKGLSVVEDWGRWSDANVAPSVQISLHEPLPNRFELNFTAQAFGPNIGQNLKVVMGSQTHYFKLKTTELYAKSIDLKGEKVSSIEFIPPEPISPAELGMIGDTRKLGIALHHLSFKN